MGTRATHIWLTVSLLPPVMASAAVFTGGGGTRIEGTLDSYPSEEFTLRFFASAEADPSDHGEGELYLGSERVNTDPSGAGSFRATLRPRAPAGYFITATATGVQGGRRTSEFSGLARMPARSGGATAFAPLIIVAALAALAFLAKWLLGRRA